MNDLASSIVSHVTSDTTVSALISSRMYPSYDRESDRQYPMAVYTLDVSPLSAFDGPVGVSYSTLRIAAVDATYIGAVALSKAIMSCLNGASGTWDGVEVDGVFANESAIKDDVVTEPTTEAILAYVRELSFDVVSHD